jgi:hypothetical protein
LVGFFCFRVNDSQIDLEQRRGSGGGFATCKRVVISLPFERLYFWIVKSFSMLTVGFLAGCDIA